MSKTIDQKVVQMQFDNQNFERNAKETMSTLDKLKAALKFDGASKGAEELSKGIKNVGTDFNQCEIMATKAGFHIQDVWLKISNVLEYRIARKIVSLGENLAKSLTLDQVNAGFREYELKMGSIQTIMAGTGEKLEVVNKYLNELNEYSDKTIYSFSDMTQNIGKFTNAGVKLKDAVAAIQGVANVAAVSGANANEASRAMYNFAQALSAGYVKLIDWKSIENANMATVEFKDTLLQTAVAMGKAKDNGNGMYKVLTKNAQGKSLEGAISATKNFNDSLSYQWMTTEVLTQALEIYSKDVRTMSQAEREAYEEKLRGQGFTDKQIEQFEELGIKATKAASEVKTFSQLMDTIKESIGSGWAMSFEHIIGNFNEAKELFTRVNDAVGVVIAQIDNKRNAMLENWKHMSVGGREDLIEAFANLGKALGEWITPIKKVFDELFGTLDSRKLANIVKAFKDWTETIRLNEEQQENLRRALHYLLTPLKVVVEIVKFLIKLIPPLIQLGTDIIQMIISIAGILATVLRKNILKHTKEINRGLSEIKKLFISLASAIRTVVVGAFSYLSRSLKDSNSWLNKTLALLKAVGAITLVGLRTAFNAIANIKLSNITDSLDKIKAKLKELGTNNAVFKFLLDTFEKLKAGVKVLTETFTIFFETLKARLENVNSFGEFLGAIWDSLKDAYTFLKDFIESKFFTDGPGLFEKIKTAFSDFIAVLEGGLDKIPWAKLILVAFTIALGSCIINLVTAISRFGSLAMALKETISILNQTIKTFTGLRNRLIELKEIGIFIATLSLSIGLLAYLDSQGANIVKAAATLGILAAGLMVLAEAMLWINTKNALAPASIASLMLSIGTLVAGTAMLVAAAAALRNMAMSFKETLPYLETLGVLMAGMLAAMTVLTLVARDHKVFATGATTILAYASSVYILTKALSQMSQIQFPNIKDLLKVLAEIFAGFTLLFAVSGRLSVAGSKGSFLFGGANAKSGFNILLMAASLKVMAMAFEQMASLNMTDDAKKVLDMLINLTKYIATIVATSIVLKTLFTKQNLVAKQVLKGAGKLSGIMNAFSLAILSIAGSFFIVSKAFETLKDNLVTSEDRTLFVATLGGFLVMIAALTAIFVGLSKTKAVTINEKDLLKFALSITALTTALLPLALCLDLLAGIVSNHTPGEIAGAAGIMTGVGLVMAALMWAAGQASFTSFQVLLTIFGSFSILLAELVAITFVVEKHGAAMAWALGAMAGVATIMGLLVLALSAIEKKIGHTDFKSLIAICSSLAILAGVLIGLTILTDSKGAAVAGALAALLGIAVIMGGTFAAFALIQKKLSTASGIIKPLIAVVAGFVTMAGVLVALALVIEQHGDAIEEAMGKMTMIGMGLTAVFAAFSWINKELGSAGDWATLLSFGAVIAATAAGLILLAQVPFDKLADAALVLTLTTTGIAGLLTILTVVANGTGETGALVMGIIAAAIIGCALAMSLLAETASHFVNAIANMITAMVDLGRNGDQVAEGMKKVTTSIVDSIDRIATSIKDAAPKLAVAAEQIMVGIAKGINAGSTYIALAIANVIQILTPVITEAIATIASMLWDGIKTLLKGLLDSVLDFQATGTALLQAMIEGLTPSGGEFASIAAQWISTFIANLIPGVGQIFNIGAAFKQSFLNGATPSGEEMQVVYKNMETYGSNAATVFGQPIYKEMTATEKAAQNSAYKVSGTALEAMKKAGKDGSKYAQGMMKNYESAIDAGLTDIGKLYNKTLKPYIDRAKDDFGKKGLSGSIGSFLQEAKDGVKSWIYDYSIPGFDDLSESIKNVTDVSAEGASGLSGLGDAAEEAGGKAKKGAKSAKEAADEISSFVEKMEGSFNILDEFDLGIDSENPLTGDKLISNMRSNVDGMVQWSHEMKSISDKVAQGLYKKLADMGPQGYKYVHAFAQMTEEQLMQVNDLYKTSLVIPTSVTAEIYQGMNLAAGNAYTGFLNGLHIEEFQQLGITLATGFLTGLAGPAGMDSHSPSKKTEEQGIYAVQGIDKGLKNSSAREAMFYTISDMCRQIIEKFRFGLSANNFKDIGQQILRGLNNGITSKNPDVLASVTDLSTSVINKARTILKIQSPSKVFAEIGEYLDLGLAKGINDNMSSVDQSVSKLADSTVNNMRDAINTIQAVVNSDMDVEPVIRPVVDLSNIQNGGNMINSLLGPTFGTNVTMPAASFMQTSQLISNTDNTNVVDAVVALQEDVIGLKDAMTKMSVVLDTGTMVGAMTPAIDQQLGARQVLAGRGI